MLLQNYPAASSVGRLTRSESLETTEILQESDGASKFTPPRAMEFYSKDSDSEGKERIARLHQKNYSMSTSPQVPSHQSIYTYCISTVRIPSINSVNDVSSRTRTMIKLSVATRLYCTRASGASNSAPNGCRSRATSRSARVLRSN